MYLSAEGPANEGVGGNGRCEWKFFRCDVIKRGEEN